MAHYFTEEEGKRYNNYDLALKSCVESVEVEDTCLVFTWIVRWIKLSMNSCSEFSKLVKLV